MPSHRRRTATTATDRLISDTFEPNGNTITRDGATYAYDFADRLKTKNGGEVTITYDGDGSRVAKTVGGVTTRFLVDNLNPTGYSQVLEEVVGGVVQRVYAYGNALISQSRASGTTLATSFYGYDAQGNVTFLTDAAGSVTDTYAYDAFGNLVAQTGTTPNLYLYGGQQFEPDLGTYALRARYYEPNRGRFLTTDPFDGVLKAPPSLHKYSYAQADAVNLSDPTGRAVALPYPKLSEVGIKLVDLALGAVVFTLGRYMAAVGTAAGDSGVKNAGDFITAISPLAVLNGQAVAVAAATCVFNAAASAFGPALPLPMCKVGKQPCEDKQKARDECFELCDDFDGRKPLPREGKRAKAVAGRWC